MTFDEILKHYKDQGSGPLNKGVAGAIRGLGYTKQTLYNWRDSGIPLRTQELIAVKTGLPVRERDAETPRRGRK